MKRILQLTFCTFSHQCLLLLVCLMCALPSWADKTSGNVTYKIEGDNAVVTGLADAALKAITIPGEIEGHKVVIGNRAFSWCTNLTSVTMSKGVTRIGYEAFYNCSSLTTITIPEGVTNIGDGAFWLCSNLESVTIPEGVTTLGYKAFANCSNLATITIPEGVTTIGDEAFSGCSKLTSISLPSTIQNLTGKTFANWYGTLNVTSNDLSFENGALFNSNKQKLIAYCSNSNNYAIPTSVTSIGKGAFYGCNNLNTLTISENVTDIDTEAFSNCINLTTVAIPASVTRIGEGAFQKCTKLTSLTMQNGVTNIERYAFSGCKRLATIALPQGVKILGDYAFDGCASLTSVTLPEGLTHIGMGAFTNCAKLKSINIPSSVNDLTGRTFADWYGNLTVSSANYTFDNGVLYNQNKQKVIAYCSENDSYEVPNSVTSIGDGAFMNCANLTSIKLYNNVTSIEDWAFAGCSGLQFIEIPTHVNSIGKFAFDYCTGLTSINIPENVKNIGQGAFNKCTSLATVTMSQEVTGIESWAFSGCSSLTSLIIVKGVTGIGDYAFYDCSGLVSVTIPEKVTNIGDHAFVDCTALTEVTCKATVVPNSTNSFSEDGTMPSEVKLYVPAESLDAYKTSPTWNIFNEIESLSYIAINISAAQKTTYCSDQALDFTNTTGVKAYIASGFSPSTGIVLLTRVKKVPAGVGFMLIGSEGKYDIPFCETDFSYANLFVGTVSETTVSGTAAGKNNYVLGNGNEGVKFYLANNTVVPAHKAYLSIPAAIMGAPAKTISFAFEDDDTTTGIITVNDMMKITNIKVYGIDGRLKNGISSGINIVNGKKIYVK